MGLSRKLCCRFVGVGVALVVVAAAQPAFAGGRESAKERAAHKACLAGDYATGVSILSDLFLASKDPVFLFNQSRCLEQSGQFAAAILHFQEFLRVGGEKLSVADKAEAEMHMADCQAQVAKQSPQPAPTPVLVAPAQPQPVVASAIPSSAAPAPASEPLGITRVGQAPEPQESPPVYKRWWFWTGIGAVVAGGVVTAVLLSSKSAAQSPACHQGGTCVP
jgi:hypothetical protein